MLTACKTSIHKRKLLTTLAHAYDIGFDGCIARLSIFEAATQDVFGVHCPNYRRHSMKHMNGRCERPIKQTGNLPTDYFNVSLSLPALSELRNWQSFSHSISRQGRSQSFMRVGASKIQWMRCYLHVQHCLPLSTSMVHRSYNSLTSL